MKKNYVKMLESLDVEKRGNITVSIANGINQQLTVWCKKRGVKKSHLIEKLVDEFLKDNNNNKEKL